MFRIVFDTTAGQWVVQFCKLELFWMTVKHGDEPLYFANLKAARDYVIEKGIPDLYHEQRPYQPNIVREYAA